MHKWDILGIEATSDLATIKKAYAKKLKIHHPEDDPMGFQALKEAYDSAIQHVKYMNRQGAPSSESYADQYLHEGGYGLESDNEFKIDHSSAENTSWLHEPIPQQDDEEYPISNLRNIRSVFFENASLNLPFDWHKANDEFIEELENIYSDFFTRINSVKWTELLNKDVLWDIENRGRLEPMVLDFLSSHYYLPQEIWKLLDQCFSLREREVQLRSEYDDPFASHVRKLLSQPIPLHYSFIREVANNQFDLYLELKENTYDFLESANQKAAEDSLNSAKKLCTSDPDLIRMEGILRLQQGHSAAALGMLNKALSLNPNDMEAFYHRACISYMANEFSKALEDLNRILPSFPSHYKSIVLAAKCHFKLKNTFIAKNLITQALRIKPGDNDARQTALLIDKKLNAVLLARLFLKPWKSRQTVKELQALHKKITSRTVMSWLAILGKWVFYALLIVLCFAIIFATRVGALVIIFQLIRLYLKKRKG